MKRLLAATGLWAASMALLAEPAPQQAKTREMRSRELVDLIHRSDRPGSRLTISWLDEFLGKHDSAKESSQWKGARQYVYTLSGGRWLEATESKEGYIYEAIIVDGKKRWLVWK